jgi:chromate transporter
MRGGFWGAWAGGCAFILPNFIMAAALGALYVHFGGLTWMTAIFYGVSPAVIALILHSCWRLGKLRMEDRFQWAVAAVSLIVTIAVQAEVAILFIGAGVLGILWYGSLFRHRATPFSALAPPVGLALLFRFKVSNPALVGATAVIRLIAFPILQPKWVFVR